MNDWLQATRPIKPESLKVRPRNIPADLRATPQWVGWKYDWVEEKCKWQKPPVCPANGRLASVRDKTHWGSFEEAFASVEKYGLDGVGFVFTEDDSYAGIDLDKCRNPHTNSVDPWAWWIVERMASYVEASPSGGGLKVFFRGRLPRVGRKGLIEVYDREHYFTVTGCTLKLSPPTVEERDASGLASALSLPSYDDETVLKNARRAANHQKFCRLWEGDTVGYLSQSQADMALCNMLAYWCGPDPEQIERLFWQSKLGERRKWERREDYRDRTVLEAIHGWVKLNWSPGYNQDTQDIQATQAIQEVSTGRSTAETSPVEVSPAVKEKAVQFAADLAGDKVKVAEGNAMFVLARKLLGLAGKTGVEASAFEDAVVRFSELTGQDVEENWAAFVVAWDKVKMAEGETPQTWALNVATKEPFPVPAGRLEAKYALAASILYHLSELRKPKTFWLTGTDLAPLLNVSEKTAYNYLTMLEKRGVIQCMRKANHAAGLAREYKFTARRPEGAAA